MEWPDETVLWFVEDMKNTPALWDPHDPRYTRQTVKQEAWTKIGAKYKIDPIEAKKKWQSLQASYRRERTKVKSGKDSVWFAFQSMSFLGMETRKGLTPELIIDGDREWMTFNVDSIFSKKKEPKWDSYQTKVISKATFKVELKKAEITSTVLIEDSEPKDVDIYSPSEVDIYTPTVTLTTQTSCDGTEYRPTYNNDSQYQTYDSPNNSSSLLRMSLVQAPQTAQIKRRRKSSENNDASVHDKLQDDQFETAGRNVIAKLRILPKTQRILAERLIYDVLLEAELGNLSRNSKLQI